VRSREQESLILDRAVKVKVENYKWGNYVDSGLARLWLCMGPVDV